LDGLEKLLNKEIQEYTCLSQIFASQIDKSGFVCEFSHRRESKRQAEIKAWKESKQKKKKKKGATLGFTMDDGAVLVYHFIFVRCFREKGQRKRQ